MTRKKVENPDEPVTLTKHLEELRNRLLKAVLAIIAASAIVYGFVDKIYDHMVRPVGQLVFIAPQEAFVTRIKIAFFGGLFLSLPVILYQVWKFISVGLRQGERKYTLLFGPLSFVFFGLGAAFGYAIIAPIGLKFLLSFATKDIVPMISVSKYISFLTMLTIAFGVVFELPLVSLFLTKIGVVTPRFLSEKRRHAIVGIFIAAAVFTPPDVITQTLMAVPLLVLYEIGIIFSKMVSKQPK
ncbi:MAG: twin-arginine translocase subunit TatC [Omnitrophica bacterium]|nr:twin-arginine translocase subunit TatC [Candidatus Omnitrophota bacterium]